MKTIQQDLKSSDLNMDDAVDLAQNLEIDVYVRRYALLVVLARNDDDESPGFTTRNIRRNNIDTNNYYCSYLYHCCYSFYIVITLFF